MTEMKGASMATNLHLSFAVHPGLWLRSKTLEPHDLSVSGASVKLRVSNLLRDCTGLSAEMAARFEKAFGLSADTLMRMQAAYDLTPGRSI